MAKTLLNFTNEILKKADLLDSDVGVLTSLTDSGRQSYIDQAIQCANEVISQLYAEAGTPKPKVLTSSTITLVTSTRTYSLASDLVRLRPEFHLIDRTNNHIIYFDMEEGAYARMIVADLEQDDTGLPSRATISPVDGTIYFDRAPSSEHNGKVFTYFYEKSLTLSALTDTVPFSDIVFESLVGAAYERFTYLNRKELNLGVYNFHMALAAKYLRQIPARKSWGKNAPVENATDPLQ